MPSPAERYAASRQRQPTPRTHLEPVPRDVPLRARPVPGRGLPGARGRPRRPRRRADRVRQDGGRRVRRAPGAGRGPQVLLHDADQGAVQPEVRRPRAGATAPSSVGLLTGDNSVNGEAPVVVMTTEVLRNMLYAGSLDAGRPRLRRDGRGALPRRPVPRRRLGGGDHPPAGVGTPGLAVGHGEQRRGVRRVAGDGPRRHRRSSSRSTGRCRCGST